MRRILLIFFAAANDSFGRRFILAFKTHLLDKFCANGYNRGRGDGVIIGSYEHFDPDQSKGFRIWVSENMTYVTHMHRHLELLSMRKGRMLVTVNGQNHWLEEGDLCLVLSNRLH